MNATDSFRIDFFDNWLVFRADPESLAQQVKALVTDPAWTAMPVVERRSAELFLQRCAVDANAAGVELVAVHAQREDTEEETVTLATSIVSVLTSADMGSDLPLTPYVLQAALSLPSADGPVLQGSKSRNLEPPSVISLPSGQCTRSRRVVEQKLGNDELVMYTDTFFVPIPDAPDRMVLLQFSTPHLDAVELFAEYFHELAKSLRFYREGEVTEL